MTLADGHAIIERILANEPDLLRYQIWVFTNAAGRGVDQIVAEQRFVEVAPGRTRFEWTYAMAPKSIVTRPFVARMRTRTLQPYLQDAADAMAGAVAATRQGSPPTPPASPRPR